MPFVVETISMLLLSFSILPTTSQPFLVTPATEPIKSTRVITHGSPPITHFAEGLVVLDPVQFALNVAGGELAYIRLELDISTRSGEYSRVQYKVCYTDVQPVR